MESLEQQEAGPDNPSRDATPSAPDESAAAGSDVQGVKTVGADEESMVAGQDEDLFLAEDLGVSGEMTGDARSEGDEFMADYQAVALIALEKQDSWYRSRVT